MVRDLPFFVDHIPNYHVFQFGKQNRWPVPNSTWKVSQELQLIHRDVVGPQKHHNYMIVSTIFFPLMISQECAGFFFKSSSQKWLEFSISLRNWWKIKVALIYKL